MQVDSAHCGGVAKLIIEQNHLVSTSSQYCPHSTISPQVAHCRGVVKLVIEQNQLVLTTSQHFPHQWWGILRGHMGIHVIIGLHVLRKWGNPGR